MQAQSGCTDPQASNYAENAVENDGSCLYATTNYALENIVDLNANLEEISGLAFFNNSLWTHTDGGGEDKLYRIDTLSGEVTKTVIIATADNQDWEDMAQSDTHVFIGDFGNNQGNRTNLRIYRIKKSDLENATVVNADLIEFGYGDQTDFTAAPNDHDFDCEAFFYHNGELHLFTKNWTDFQTRYYRFSAEPGSYTPQPQTTFAANGLLTAADINADGTIALLGYTTAGTNFMWLLFDYPPDDIFGGNKRRINLGNALQNSQTEALAFSDSGRGFIGSEKFSLLPAKLLKFTTAQWTQNTMVSNTEFKQSPDFQVFPNPAHNFLTVKSVFNTGNIELRNAQGKRVLRQAVTDFSTTVTTENLPCGVYSLSLFSAGNIYTEKFIKL